MPVITITVPLEPPSVNHYVKHTRSGRHYKTPEAIAFQQALALFAKHQSIKAKAYRVHYTVYQGKGSRGDVDNYAKCILDGMVHAGVIHSDAAITELSMAKQRDWENPRTEIRVEGVVNDSASKTAPSLI